MSLEPVIKQGDPDRNCKICPCEEYAILVGCVYYDGEVDFCESMKTINIYKVYKDDQGRYHAMRKDGPVMGELYGNVIFHIYMGPVTDEGLYDLEDEMVEINDSEELRIRIVKEYCNCDVRHCVTEWKYVADPNTLEWHFQSFSTECYDYDEDEDRFMEGPWVDGGLEAELDEWEIDCCAGTATYFQYNGREECMDEEEDYEEPELPEECPDMHCVAVWKAIFDNAWIVDEEPVETGCYEFNNEVGMFVDGPGAATPLDDWEIDCCAKTATYVQDNGSLTFEKDECETKAKQPPGPEDCPKMHCVAVWKATFDNVWIVDEAPVETGCYEFDEEVGMFTEGPGIAKPLDDWNIDCDAGTATYIQDNGECFDCAGECEDYTKPSVPDYDCSCETISIPVEVGPFEQTIGWQLLAVLYSGVAQCDVDISATGRACNALRVRIDGSLSSGDNDVICGCNYHNGGIIGRASEGQHIVVELWDNCSGGGFTGTITITPRHT